MIFKLLIFVVGLGAAHSVNFYRKDYTYNQEHDAFYKMIWSEDGEVFETAFMACDDEGSQLFYPTDKHEWKVIKNLTEAMPTMPNTTEVLVGIRDEVGNGQYTSINGHIITSHISDQDASLDRNCVVMDLDIGILTSTDCNGERNKPRLFVCKKMDDSPCPTIDSGYKYNEQTKKCYKVNPRRKSWKDAMQTCNMEGGLLVVVETEEEAKIINKMLPHLENAQNFHSGFRKISGKFYTLKGKKLEDSYNRWSENGQALPRSNGYENVDEEENQRKYLPAPPSFHCGILRKKHNYDVIFTSSTNCAELNPFICEIQARF